MTFDTTVYQQHILDDNHEHVSRPVGSRPQSAPHGAALLLYDIMIAYGITGGQKASHFWNLGVPHCPAIYHALSRRSWEPL